jgi:hypothetical protein
MRIAGEYERRTVYQRPSPAPARPAIIRLKIMQLARKVVVDSTHAEGRPKSAIKSNTTVAF